MWRNMAVGVLLLGVVVGTSGCVALLAGGAAAGGTALWLSDKLVQEVNAPLDRSVAAAERALDSLSLPLNKKTVKADVAQLMSTHTDGKTIWIDVHRVSDSRSRIEVRVGAIAEEDAARKILDRIVGYL